MEKKKIKDFLKEKIEVKKKYRLKKVVACKLNLKKKIIKKWNKTVHI